MSEQIISLNLQNGISLNLSKDYSTLKNITMGLGWDIADGDDDNWDLDSIAVALDAKGNILETICFHNKTWTGIRLDKDNTDGEGDGPDENIFVNLNEIQSNVVKIAFFANIFSAGSRDFSGVRNAFINLTNRDNNQEIARYNLNEKGEGYNAFHFGDIDRINGEWLFTAVGTGTNGSIETVAKKFSKEMKSNLGIIDSKKKGLFGKLFS